MGILRERMDYLQAKEKLLGQLLDPPQKLKNRSFQQAKIDRQEITLAGTNLLDWLRRQPFFPRFYWQDREGRTEWAGAGTVIHLTGDRLTDYRENLIRPGKF